MSDPMTIIARPPKKSLLLDKSKETELRAFEQSRFGHLEGKERNLALWDFYSANFMDFCHLDDIGNERLFTPDELSEYQHTRDAELFAGNDVSRDSRQVMKNQAQFADLVETEKVKERPATTRQFEKLLRDSGFSKNDARAVAENGFSVLAGS